MLEASDRFSFRDLAVRQYYKFFFNGSTIAVSFFMLGISGTVADAGTIPQQPNTETR